MKRLTTTRAVVHHSVLPQKMSRIDAMDTITRIHRQNGLAYDSYMAYHHVIGHNWEEFGRPLGTVGYHAGHWWTNLTSVAVCVMGNFQTDKLNAYQQDRLRNRLQYWSDLYKLNRSNILIHRDVKATACPGNNITHAVIDDIYSRPRVPTKRTPLPRQKGK